MKLQDILTQPEIEAIQKFLDNKPLKNGIKKVLLSSVYEQGTIPLKGKYDPNFNFAISLVYDLQQNIEYKLNNEELGEKLRASVAGIRLLQQGFKDLESLGVKEEKVEEEINEAR